MRRIKLRTNGEQYQIRPSFMMPYMIGRIEEVEKALYYRRWGVPFDALAYGFGRHPMYWYRAYVSLGRASLVGTTIKDPHRLPAHVLADEKPSRRQGNKAYIPTTVAQECILGAEVAKAYKPDPKTYLTGAELLDLPPERVMMVAAHSFDLVAASEAGLRTAFVSRPNEYGDPALADTPPAGAFDLLAGDFNDLASQLNCL